MRAGMIGAGWIAQRHAPAIDAADGVDLVAVCDADTARAHAVADPRGANAYASWEEMLDRETLDALWVCVPPLLHRAPAVAALERGTHVYLEKPIARDLPDAQAIVDAAETSAAVCMVGYQWHASELLDDVRNAVANRRVAMLIGRNYGPAALRAWVVDRRQGGGQILERGSHHIDLQRAIAGEISAVEVVRGSVGLVKSTGQDESAEDVLVLLFHFAGGALGAVNLAWTADGQPEVYSLDVIAQDSSLWLDLGPSRFRVRGVAGGGQVDAAYGDPFDRSVARFLDAARARDQSRVFCTPADALRSLRVAVACERALVQKGPVAVEG